MKHDFNDKNICTGCGVERMPGAKKCFHLRAGRLVNEPVCDERLKK